MTKPIGSIDVLRDHAERRVRHGYRAMVHANGAGLEHELDVLAAEVEMQNEALRDSQRELEASRAEYRELFDFAPIPYLVIGREMQILTANVAAAELLGAAWEEFVGTRVTRFIAESDAEAFERHRREVCGCTDRIRARFGIVDYAGETRTVLFESMCTNVVTGEWRTGLVDTTETNLLRRQLEQSERLCALGSNVGSIVHDMRNMIMTMSTAADVALKVLEKNSRAQRPLEQLRQATEKAGYVLKHLLAFAEEELNDPGMLDLNEALASMRSALVDHVGSDLALDLELRASDATIRMNGADLEQVVFNLAANATDAMPSGGSLVIETRNLAFSEDDPERPPALSPGRYVVLDVKDSGTGMDEATRARAFEPFFTTKPHGRGSGLGLAQVRGSARRAGGHAEISSEAGKGTTVRVYLPRASGFVRSERGAIRQILPRDLVVVIAAIEAKTRKTASEYLRTLGCEVFEAGSGFEALEALKANRSRPCVVLVDPRLRSLARPEFEAAMRALVPAAGITAAPVLSGWDPSASDGTTRHLFEQIHEAVVRALHGRGD